MLPRKRLREGPARIGMFCKGGRSACRKRCSPVMSSRLPSSLFEKPMPTGGIGVSHFAPGLLFHDSWLHGCSAWICDGEGLHPEVKSSHAGMRQGNAQDSRTKASPSGSWVAVVRQIIAIGLIGLGCEERQATRAGHMDHSGSERNFMKGMHADQSGSTKHFNSRTRGLCTVVQSAASTCKCQPLIKTVKQLA